MVNDNNLKNCLSDNVKLTITAKVVNNPNFFVYYVYNSKDEEIISFNSSTSDWQTNSTYTMEYCIDNDIYKVKGVSESYYGWYHGYIDVNINGLTISRLNCSNGFNTSIVYINSIIYIIFSNIYNEFKYIMVIF